MATTQRPLTGICLAGLSRVPGLIRLKTLFMTAGVACAASSNLGKRFHMTRYFRLRMTVKLPLLMFVMAAIAMLATGFVAYRVARTALVDQAVQRIDAATAARLSVVSDWMDKALGDVAFQAESPNVINALRAFEGAWASSETDPETALREAYVTSNPYPEKNRDALDDAGDKSAYSRNHKKYHGYFRTIAHRQGYDDIYLIGRDGAVLYSTFKTDEFARRETPQSLKGAVEAARAAPEGRGAMPDVRINARGEAAIEFAALIRDGGGNPMGVLIYRVSGSKLTGLISDPVADAAGGASFIETTDGTLIASVGAPDFSDATADEDKQGGAQHIIESAQVLTRDTTSWRIVTQNPLAQLIKPATELLRTLAAQSAVVLAVMTSAGIWMGHSIARPLDKVRRAMRHISEGAHDQPVPAIDRQDEIGDIARTLQEFQSALQGAEKTRAENRQKSAAMDASSAAIMILNPQGRIVYGNPAVQAILAQLRIVSSGQQPEGAPLWLPAQVRAAIAAQNSDHTTCHMVLADISVTLTLNAIRDADDALSGWVLEWADVTETQNAQAVMATLNAYQIRADFAPDGSVLKANDNWALALKDEKNRFNIADLADDVAGLNWATVRAGSPWSGQLVLPGDDGTVVVQGSLSPTRDIDGTIRSIVLLGADVTDADRALKAAAASRKAMQAAQAKVVDSLRAGLARLSQGDLRAKITEVFPDEYEQLRRDFNVATATLASALRDVAASSATIRTQSDDISAAALRLAAQNQSQASALQLVSANIATLSSRAQTAASQAKTSTELAAHSTRNTQKHATILEESGKAMQAILDSSQEIGEIVNVIDGISFQTNLLALNAGVEAARAGPAGRGFAVVANEVRALAQRSADAALQINQLITLSAEHVRHGVELFDKTGQALASVGTSASDISTRMNEIATSGEDQSRAISEVNMSVSDIDRTTQENAAMFEQTSAASRILLAQSEMLVETLSVFTLEGCDPQKATLKAVG